MNLVEERDAWRASFKEGKLYSKILQDYRDNRNSELWRLSKNIEYLCEYVLFLEGAIHDIACGLEDTKFG